jgi:hypothetical protein
MIFISDNDAPIGRDPTEGSLDCISSPVAIPESVVLSVNIPVVPSVRSQKADPASFQASSNRVAIVGLVADHPLGSGHGSSGSSFGTRISPRALSRSVTSAGEALSVWLPRGRPLTSTDTRDFDPFPRLVFPISAPLLLPERGFQP